MSPSSLSVRTTLFCGFGSVAFDGKDNGVAFLVMRYDNQVLGFPEHWVGFGIMIALIVDAGAGDCGGHHGISHQL